MPRYVVSDQILDSAGKCLLHLSWFTPENTAASDIMHYIVNVNGENSINQPSNADQYLTTAAYSLCNCTSNTVYIYAVNHCGHIGQSTPIFYTGPDPKVLPTVMCTLNGDLIITTETESSFTTCTVPQGQSEGIYIPVRS